MLFSALRLIVGFSITNTLTANELKTRGVSVVEEGLKHDDELVIQDGDTILVDVGNHDHVS